MVSYLSIVHVFAFGAMPCTYQIGRVTTDYACTEAKHASNTEPALHRQSIVSAATLAMELVASEVTLVSV